MSLKTWKSEFYPALSRCKKADALDHSIRKWEGLRPKNLEKHAVKVGYSMSLVNVGDVWGPEIRIDYSTCALCKFYSKERHVMNECKECPIVEVTGDDCDGIFRNWVKNNNPEPMIRLLKKVKENLL